MRNNVARNTFARRVFAAVSLIPVRDIGNDIFRVNFQGILNIFCGKNELANSSRIIKLKSRRAADDEIACVRSSKKRKRCISSAGSNGLPSVASVLDGQGAFFVSEIFSECIDSRLGIRNGVLRNLIIRHRQLSRVPFFAGTGCVVVFRLSIGK